MPLSCDKGRQVPLWVRLIGSFSDEDGDGNENVKKNNKVFIEQNNKFARASRFFLHFFAVTKKRLKVKGFFIVEIALSLSS